MYFALFKWVWHVGGVEAIFLLQKYINIKPCQPSFFGRGLLAESVNKDSMVKLTLSQTNLLISLLSKFVEFGSSKTHITPQRSVAMSLSTVLSPPCMSALEGCRKQIWEENPDCSSERACTARVRKMEPILILHI